MTIPHSPKFRFTFSGGFNITLEGSEDLHCGWVNSHGQQVGEKLLICGGRALTELVQWWNEMQNISLQVNRPHGWGFHNITGGEIKYMKLWQVSISTVQRLPRGY